MRSFDLYMRSINNVSSEPSFSIKPEKGVWSIQIIGAGCTVIITLLVIFWISITKRCDLGDAFLACMMVCIGFGLIVFTPPIFIPIVVHSLINVVIIGISISILIVVVEILKEYIYNVARFYIDRKNSKKKTS